ncbi:unnamed protein product, partial [Laminaria digitata]
MPRSSVQSERRGGDPATGPATVRPGDAAGETRSVLPAQNQQVTDKPNPASPVVKTLKALVGNGSTMDTMRNAVLGPSERGRKDSGTQPPSLPAAADASAVGAVGGVAAVAAADPVPSPDPKGRVEEIAA